VPRQKRKKLRPKLLRPKLARRPLPEHLPRERIVYSGPSSCPCCGGALHKLGEDVTETLELIPRQWKVIQHVREKFSCRSCETITQPPAPSHPISRGRAGPVLLAHLLFAKYGLHLPLNRQSNVYAREGIDLDVSTTGWPMPLRRSTNHQPIVDLDILTVRFPLTDNKQIIWRMARRARLRPVTAELRADRSWQG
jgi:transposase